MATLAGLTLVKHFPYRDIPSEETSNQYWFKSSPPGDEASWTVLMNDVLNWEKIVFPDTVKYVRAYGYDDDSSTANHVFAHTFDPGTPPAGTYPGVGGFLMAGDQAAMVSWKTDKLNSRGKPIYLRKYLHHGYVDSTNNDRLVDSYHTALLNYAGNIRGLHGGLTNPSSEHHPGGSESVVSYDASIWVTTRSLRRRGKRPKTGN